MIIELDTPVDYVVDESRDKLNRQQFGQSLAQILLETRGQHGLVASIEGPWGSGKTSLISSIKKAISDQELERNSIIYDFNPWLMGDKDALLQSFFNGLSHTIGKSTDRSEKAIKVAEELNAYSNIFALMKMVEITEPYSAIAVQSFKTGGKAVKEIAKLKKNSISRQKEIVIKSLNALETPVIIFIDDSDRLLPEELYEIIRIIKSVGELPWVRYVVAWDPIYVASSLETMGVPQSGSYLDKIVQLRLPIPALTDAQKLHLINYQISQFPEDAMTTGLEGEGERLRNTYNHILKDIYTTPRDFISVFNLVRVMEPNLRGEIVFSDIICLATLSIKAREVYHLLKTKPWVLVPDLSKNKTLRKKSNEDNEENNDELVSAIRKSEYPHAISRLIEEIFPKALTSSEKIKILTGPRYDAGHLSHPKRIEIALQLTTSTNNAKISAVSGCLFGDKSLNTVIKDIEGVAIEDFADLAVTITSSTKINDLDKATMAATQICSYIDQEKVSGFFHTQSRHYLSNVPPPWYVYNCLNNILEQFDEIHDKRKILRAVCEHSDVYFIAMQLLENNVNQTKQLFTILDREYCDNQLTNYFDRVYIAIARGEFFNTFQPGITLRVMAEEKSHLCAPIFSLIKRSPENTDIFFESFLKSGSDSVGGQMYQRSDEVQNIITRFCDFSTITSIAKSRLNQARLEYPYRAVYQSILDGECYYHNGILCNQW